MRDIVKGGISAAIAVLFFTFVIAPHVKAQVSIQQSQSSSVNGQSSSVQTDSSSNGKTEIKTMHGTLVLEGDHVKYCGKDGCGQNYTLENNGTIRFP